MPDAAHTAPNATGSVATAPARSPSSSRHRRRTDLPPRLEQARAHRAAGLAAARRGRSACMSASSSASSSQCRRERSARHARPRGRPSAPSASSRHASIHARRSSAVDTAPPAVADSSPSECENAPIGKQTVAEVKEREHVSPQCRVIRRCLRAGVKGRTSRVEWNPVLLEHLLHARQVGAHDRIVRDHQRLMAVADVIRRSGPHSGGVRRSHDEHRLGRFNNHDDQRELVDDEAVASAEDRPARQRCANSRPPSASPRARAFRRSSQPSVIVSRAYAAPAQGSASCAEQFARRSAIGLEQLQHRSEQEIPLRKRQHVGRFARQQLAVGAHFVRVGIDLDVRQRIVEDQVLLAERRGSR